MPIRNLTHVTLAPPRAALVLGETLPPPQEKRGAEEYSRSRAGRGGGWDGVGCEGTARQSEGEETYRD
jgi:hypothetical protein